MTFDFLTEPKMWECLCDEDFLHPMDVAKCIRCGVAQKDGQAADDDDVAEMVLNGAPQPEDNE